MLRLTLDALARDCEAIRATSPVFIHCRTQSNRDLDFKYIEYTLTYTLRSKSISEFIYPLNSWDSLLPVVERIPGSSSSVTFLSTYPWPSSTLEYVWICIEGERMLPGSRNNSHLQLRNAKSIASLSHFQGVRIVSFGNAAVFY